VLAFFPPAAAVRRQIGSLRPDDLTFPIDGA
jgi:hypothetical protein